jgi:flagellar hook-associated protein FlgK
MGGFSMHRNVYDVQRQAAIAKLDKEIQEDHANGYDVGELLDRRQALVEAIRNGPFA